MVDSRGFSFLFISLGLHIIALFALGAFFKTPSFEEIKRHIIVYPISVVFGEKAPEPPTPPEPENQVASKNSTPEKLPAALVKTKLAEKKMEKRPELKPPKRMSMRKSPLPIPALEKKRHQKVVMELKDSLAEPMDIPMPEIKQDSPNLPELPVAAPAIPKVIRQNKENPAIPRKITQLAKAEIPSPRSEGNQAGKSLDALTPTPMGESAVSSYQRHESAGESAKSEPAGSKENAEITGPAISKDKESQPQRPVQAGKKGNQPAASPKKAFSGEGLMRFRGMVADRIDSVKAYPMEARRERQAGKVVISFVISPSGSAGCVNVVQSSGFSSLDGAARDAVQAGAPYLPYPEGLEKPISIKMTVNFRLE